MDHRMDDAGLQDRFHGRLREPDIPDLAGMDQIGHGADRVFDGNRCINPVDIVQIDRFRQF